MTTLVALEKLALELSECDRASLAASILQSLPAILSDMDGGLVEVQKRDRELEFNPDMVLTLKEFDQKILDRRNK